QADRPILGPSPAVGTSVDRDPAGVVVTGGHRRPGPLLGDRRGHPHRRRIWKPGGGYRPPAETQLPAVVVAPAVAPAVPLRVAAQAAGETEPDAHFGPLSPADD